MRDSLSTIIKLCIVAFHKPNVKKPLTFVAKARSAWLNVLTADSHKSLKERSHERWRWSVVQLSTQCLTVVLSSVSVIIYNDIWQV